MKDSTNARQTSSQTPQALSVALGSALTQLKPSTNSTIGQNQSGQNITTGKPLSEILLEDLRKTAIQAAQGTEVTDKRLLALLTQHFGSRLVLKQKTAPIYSDEYGYDEKITGYEISLQDGLGTAEAKIADFVASLLRPAKPLVVSGMVAKMRVSLMRRQESEQDIEVLIDTVTGFLSEYPTDIVVSVCDHCIKTMRFFPIVKELLALCEARMTMRRSLQTFFSQPPALTAQQPTPATRARSWKETPKPQWQAAEWAGYCAEAMGMAEQARSFPAAFDLEFWVTETARRRVEAGASGFEQQDCGQRAAHNIKTAGDNLAQGASL